MGRDALGRDNHARGRLLSRALNRHGVDTWLDEDRLLGGNIEARIARGIEASVAVLRVRPPRTYCAKVERACLPGARHDYCASEWHYARLRRKPLIPVLMEPLADWPPGVVGMHMWPLQYADFSGFRAARCVDARPATRTTRARPRGSSCSSSTRGRFSGLTPTHSNDSSISLSEASTCAVTLAEDGPALEEQRLAALDGLRQLVDSDLAVLDVLAEALDRPELVVVRRAVLGHVEKKVGGAYSIARCSDL